MDRKLASIRIVSDVCAIDGADNIELVMVDGWQCVAKKGDFVPGQHCVYFEIDSFLPIRPEFEFLRKSSYRKMGEREGFRLRTIKLRGQISQGLVMPESAFFNELPQNIIYFDNDDGYGNGFDVTEDLGIIKYQPPIPAQLVGKVKGNSPSFIRKTDQERIQNLWNKIKDSTETFEITQKLDGTSCTYYLNEGIFGVCSKNLELLETEGNTLWRLAREGKIEESLRSYDGKNIALQGEVIGEGIQGNPEKIKGQEFRLFDIWNIDKQEYFKPNERRDIWRSLFFMFGSVVLHVPIIDNETSLNIYNISKSISQILLAADGYSKLTGSERLLDAKPSYREGLVFKSNSSGLSFKVISNKYLLNE